MTPQDRMMKVEVLVRDKAGSEGWVTCPDFGALEVDDIIRWFNPDGSPAYDGAQMRVTAPAAIKVQYGPELLATAKTGEARV